MAYRKGMHKKALSMALLTLMLGGAAQAGGGGAAPTGMMNAQVQAASPASVAATLRESGYTVTMKPTDPDQDPSMTVKVGSKEYEVWLSACKNNLCSRVTASTSWDYSDSKDEPDYKMLNEWNGGYFTQAYSSDGSYYLDYTMFIKGGYTKATLKSWFADYLDDVTEFEDNLPEA